MVTMPPPAAPLTSQTFQPGYIPTTSTAPVGLRSYDYPTWMASVAKTMGDNIAFNNGAGYPQGWNFGQLGTWGNDIGTGAVSGATLAKINSYLSAYQPGQDPWIDENFPMPAMTGNEFVESPETFANRIAREQWEKNYGLNSRQQDLAEFKFATELAMASASRSGGSSSGGSSSRSSGGATGLGTNSADYGLRLGYEQESNDLDLAQKRALNALELQFIKDKNAMGVTDPYQLAVLALQKEQFAADEAYRAQQLALQQQGLQADMAETKMKAWADPRDTVARNYSSHGMPEPLGTPQDIFTNEVTGSPITRTVLQQQQVPVIPDPNAPVAGQTTPPPATGGVPPVEEPPPAFATGTDVWGGTAPPRGNPTPVPTGPMATPMPAQPPPTGVAMNPALAPMYDSGPGFTTAPEMKVGEQGIEGIQNPTGAPIRVINNEQMSGERPQPGPQFGQLTAASSMARTSHPQGRTMPPQAQAFQPSSDVTLGREMGRTVPPPAGRPMQTQWAQRRTRQGLRARPPGFATGTDYQTPEATAPVSPWADLSRWGIGDGPIGPQAGLAYTPSTAGPSVAGVDPYYGTSYAGMDANAPVTNANSRYYGMTADAAYKASLAEATAPVGYTVGPEYQTYTNNTQMMTKDPRTGAKTITNSGTPVSTSGYVNVANQAGAGILTGAQISQGATQTKNPALAGYQAPAGTFTQPVAAPTATQPPPATTTARTSVPVAADSATSTATPPPAATTPLGTPVGLTEQPDFVNFTYTQGADGKWYKQPVGSTTQPPPVTTADAKPAATAATTSGEAQFAQPNSAGGAVVTQPGTITSKGATYTLQSGDVRQPDGRYERWNAVSKQYEPVLPKVTIISSEDQFWALPDDVQQQILTGQATGYVLNDKGIDTKALSPEALANQSAGLQPGRSYPGDWVGQMLSRGTQQPTLSMEQFYALPDAEQRRLIEQGAGVTTGAGSNLDVNPLTNSPLTTFTLNSGESDFVDSPYQSQLTEADWIRLFPEVYDQRTMPPQAIDITPTPTGTQPPPTGTQQPPAGGTPAPPPAGSTTVPPPAAGGGTPGGVSDLTYGDSAFQNLPALLFAQGLIDEGTYNTLSAIDTEVPGLGTKIPAPGKLNPMLYDQIRQNEPDVFAALESLWGAANRNLQEELNVAMKKAPRSTAYESSLIQTV